MSKLEGEGCPIDLSLPPLKASCNYFFFEASRVKYIYIYIYIAIYVCVQCVHMCV